MTAGGAVTVREVLSVLHQWQAHLLAGESGLGRSVTWASSMRARLPAFEGFQGGEMALVSLATLRSLRTQVESLTLPAIVDQLAALGASAVALVASDAPQPDALAEQQALREAQTRAERHALALIELRSGTPLPAVERAVIAHVVARRERFALGTPAEALVSRLESSLRGEALEALLTGTYAGESQMRLRALQFGHDLTQPHSIVWIELEPPECERAHEHAPVDLATLGTQLADALGAALGAWTHTHGAQVVALLPFSAERGAGDLVARVERVLVRTLPESLAWSAGLGEPATAPAEVRRSASEAHDAERLGLGLLGPRQIARPTDLGVYRLLLALRATGDLAPFVQQALAPLLADQRTGDALVQTLEAFFACNGNLSAAARQLHLHRNSLLYRLNRARELLHRDIDDPELRLGLQLAIKGRRVLTL